MSLRHAVATVLLVAGVGVEMLAVLGLLRMRDALDRLHFVALGGFGVLLVGVAILVRASFSLIGDKALAVGVLIVVLNPVLVHTTARTVLIRDRGDWRKGIERAQEDQSA